MPGDSSVPKLNDIYIGVTDFFTILMPGVIAAYVFGRIADFVPANPDRVVWVILVVVGYVLGHVIYAVSSFLDPLVYDPLFGPDSDLTACYMMSHAQPPRKQVISRILFAIRGYCHKNHQLYAYTRKMMTESQNYKDSLPKNVFTSNELAAVNYDPGRSSARAANTFQWTRTWLRDHSPEATTDLERLEADSKLFRSLSIILPAFLLAARCQLYHTRHFLLVPVALATVVSVWRYCDLRQKAIRSCYLHFVQLYPPSSNTSAAADRPLLPGHASP